MMNELNIISFSGDDKEHLELSLQLRTEVFVNEQGVDATLEFDGKDGEARHYLVYQNDKAVGTARWRRTDKGIKLERFAILSGLRSLGIGKVLLDAIMKELSQENNVYLHAQESAVRFYLKNNFSVIGEAFTEADIVHYKMVLQK